MSTAGSRRIPGRARSDPRDREEPERRRVERAVGLRRLGGPRRDRAHGVHRCTASSIPSFMPDMTAAPRRRWRRRSPSGAAWPIEDVLAEYETYSGQAADTFATLQDPPMSETMLPMGELGTHPMSILPSMFLFDSYAHLRNDILAPNGSIDRPSRRATSSGCARRSSGCSRACRGCAPTRSRARRPAARARRSTGPAAARGRSRPAAERRPRAVTTARAGDAAATVISDRARLRHLGHAAAAVGRLREDRRRRRVRGAESST